MLGVSSRHCFEFSRMNRSVRVNASAGLTSYARQISSRTCDSTRDSARNRSMAMGWAASEWSARSVAGGCLGQALLLDFREPQCLFDLECALAAEATRDLLFDIDRPLELRR